MNEHLFIEALKHDIIQGVGRGPLYFAAGLNKYESKRKITITLAVLWNNQQITVQASHPLNSRIPSDRSHILHTLRSTLVDDVLRQIGPIDNIWYLSNTEHRLNETLYTTSVRTDGFPSTITTFNADSSNKKAEEKAEKLLLSYLTEEQKQEYKEYSRITCYGNKSKRRYQILNYKVQNIRQWIGKRGCVLCTVPKEDIPLADHMLCQLLMIQYEEDYFNKIAVCFPW